MHWAGEICLPSKPPKAYCRPYWPVPIPQPRTIDSRELEGTADRVKAVVRVPQSRRGELALRLRSASARHVAAREPGELRFQLDPKERI